MKKLGLLLAALLVSACASVPRPICQPVRPCTDKQPPPAPLIPRQVLFGLPDATRIRISPDGQQISYLAPKNGTLNLFVKTIGKDDARAVTDISEGLIRRYWWIRGGRALLYVRLSDGGNSWRLHQTVIATGVTMSLAMPWHRAVPLSIVPTSGARLLMAVRERKRGLTNVFEVKLHNGDMQKHTANPGRMRAWFADHQQRVRAGVAKSKGGARGLVVRDKAGDEWNTVRVWTNEQMGRVVGFSPDSRKLYFIDTKFTDTGRLAVYDFDNRQISKVFHHPDGEIYRVLAAWEGHKILAVRTEREKTRWHVLDESLNPAFEALRKRFGDQFDVVSRSEDDRRWIIEEVSDTRANSFHLLELGTLELSLVGQQMPNHQEYTLAPMKPVVIQARDGLKLVSFLTLPPGTTGKGQPLVLFVHGGPWVRDFWGYNRFAQWLANRGYAVLQVNYRGSAGFGKAFLNAGNKEWGKKMQDDLTDAVGWAIDSLGIDPQRVAIMGGSYGGYAALAGATFTPDLYATAVDFFGVSNVFRQMGRSPVLKTRVGNKYKEGQMLDERSPLYHADAIRIPLWVCHGGLDKRVKPEESDEMVDAIRDTGNCVEYIYYPDEGHGFMHIPNLLDFAGRIENYLARHMCGWAEPFRKSEGSSAEVK